MPALRRILVIGATGKQGGAVVKALLASPSNSSLKIFAPTRDPDSLSAQRLVAKSSNIKLIKDPMENANSIFKEIGEPIDAVFAVTIPSLKGNEKDIEEIQGKSLIDAAIANGVKHFVLTSIDRGGNRSDNAPTYVPHFITKHNVELHLKSEAAKTGMTWTILRPVCFVDNFDAGFLGRVASQWWSAMEKNTKLQVVSVKDIGVFAAKALEDPRRFKNRTISLAGDELTFAEANAKFREIYRTDIPRTFGPLGYVTKIMLKDNRLMWKWFDEFGYGADLAECREISPAMQDFKTWLKESSNHSVV